MANRQSFGRRVQVQPQPRLARTQGVAVAPRAESVPCDAPAEPPSPPSPNSDVPSLDDELEEWKQARKGNFKIPWRQLSLMASLCFGMASLVLPDWVNTNVQWLLFALMAASLYAGFSKRGLQARD